MFHLNLNLVIESDKNEIELLKAQNEAYALKIAEQEALANAEIARINTDLRRLQLRQNSATFCIPCGVEMKISRVNGGHATFTCKYCDQRIITDTSTGKVVYSTLPQ